MRGEEPNFREESAEPHSRKEAIWMEKEKEVGKIPDLESGARKIVTALNIFEISTFQSCEGHLNETGIVAPFVEISARGQPQKRFVGQEKIIKKVAKKYNIAREDVETTILVSAPWKEFEGLQETQNYKKWREKNEQIAKKAEILLQKFYHGRETAPRVCLVINEKNSGQFELTNSGGNESGQARADEQLAQYQKEMDDFAEFLKQKYIDAK